MGSFGRVYSCRAHWCCFYARVWVVVLQFCPMPSQPINQDAVFNELWPVVTELLKATVAQDEKAMRKLIVASGNAAAILTLFGPIALDILLKTVYDRDNATLTYAIQTDKGRHVFLEYAWPDVSQDNLVGEEDFVYVRLRRVGDKWRVLDINPGQINAPMTPPRARGILLDNELIKSGRGVPPDPWVLPLAFLAGAIRLPIRADALADEVERLLLPHLQEQGHSLLALVNARQLWRDFRTKGKPVIDVPLAWAAVVEYLIAEQEMVQTGEAEVAAKYHVNPIIFGQRVAQVKKTLKIVATGLDARYTSLWVTPVEVKPVEV